MDHPTDTLGASVATGEVLPEWIDINGHMNVAYYVLAFDLGVDNFWAELGLTNEYIESSQCSTFAVECHVTYQSELKEAEPFIITTQILAYDEKRIHQFQRMYHAEEKTVAATAEWMNLHVDLTDRRVAPFPQTVMDALAVFCERQGVLRRPVEAGKTMQVRKPIFTGAPE